MTSDLTITFIQPSGQAQTVTAQENQSLLQAAQMNNIKGLEGVCGGVMACASCHVYIEPEWHERSKAGDNEQTEEEIDTLDLAYDVRPTSRLSCQIKFTKALDGLVVRVPKG